MKVILTIVLMPIVFLTYSQSSNIDYFDLNRPSLIAQDFDPKVLSLEGSFVFNATFSSVGNEFYFTKVESKENIYFSTKKDGNWQSPSIASFSNPSYHDADPFFSLDGSRIYFVSSRPVNTSDTKFDYNIWYADRNNTGWDSPKALPEPINTDNEEYFFSISNEGNAYFSSNRPGGFGSFDIYTTRILENGEMTNPTNFGNPVSSSFYEYDPYIAPDESFIIYSINDKPNGIGKSDVFFSCKSENGDWSDPINLGSQVNGTEQDFAPSLSPDSKFIFFTRGGNMKWISVELLESLKANGKY